MTTVRKKFCTFGSEYPNIESIYIVPVKSQRTGLINGNNINVIYRIPHASGNNKQPGYQPSIMPPIVPYYCKDVLEHIDYLSFNALTMVVRATRSAGIPAESKLRTRQKRSATKNIHGLIIEAFIVAVPPSDNSDANNQSASSQRAK